MKQYLIGILFVLVFIRPVYAQESSVAVERKHCLKMNLLSPVLSAVNISFETQTANDYSFQLGAIYMNHATYALSDGLTKAFFVTPELRYTLTETKTGKTFVAAFLRYINMEYSQTDKYNGNTKVSTGQYESLGLGVLVGQKFIYKNRVAFELFGGPVYSGLMSAKNNFYNRADDDIVVDQDIPYTLLRRYGLRAGFTVGWMF